MPDFEPSDERGGKVDIFISPERHDTTHLPCSLLIDCKTSWALLPPATAASFMYLPFYSLSFSQRLQASPSDLVRSPANTDAAPRDRFCAFLARNCVPERQRLVDMLSKSYKPVHALGRCVQVRQAWQVPQGSA